MRCPKCKKEMVDDGPGKLDQSGHSYLPARTYLCEECGVLSTVATGEPAKTYGFIMAAATPQLTLCEFCGRMSCECEP